jgi:hypothetical protein
MDWVL